MIAAGQLLADDADFAVETLMPAVGDMRRHSRCRSCSPGVIRLVVAGIALTCAGHIGKEPIPSGEPSPQPAGK